jgi:hypothetical protein
MFYTFETIVAVLENYEFIESFLERSTNELFQVSYDYASGDDFWMQEGNTLLDKGSHNTRVPKGDKLKENLIVIKADIDKAISTLTIPEKIALWYVYQLASPKANNRKTSTALALDAVRKIVENLNNG